MKKDDIKVLMGIQKNTDMAMKVRNAVADKTYDTEMREQIKEAREAYAKLYRKATRELMDKNIDGYKSSVMQDVMLKGSITGNTLLNTSTGHIAELLIHGSSKGVTDLWKTLNRNENACDRTMEIAREFLDFEEKNIERLKKYL